MSDETFFTNPKSDWQRRYEALRASFVDRLPARVVADKFGYTSGYVNVLRHQFKTGKLNIAEPPPEGKKYRRRIDSKTRGKIISWRKQSLSVGDIVELLSEDGIEVSISTVSRVLAEEGFPKLPRRTRLKIGMTVKGAKVPKRAQQIAVRDLDGKHLESPGAGVFLFAPFLEKLDIGKVVQAAGLPGTKMIPAMNYLLSFLALKLLGTERYSHATDHSFDSGLGLFAGLNVLPKCTAMSTYSYSLDEAHIFKLQEAFVRSASHLGLYDGSMVNLDFHTMPHYGEESVLEDHWAGARGKRMKGALCLMVQDAQSKLLLYTASDIQRSESDEQVLEFLSFWKKIKRGVKPTLVFDSKFTTYPNLTKLADNNIKFITLRRRGKRLLKSVEHIKAWRRIVILHSKRKYKRPYVHDSEIYLSGYNGQIRQIVIRGNGREKPTFIITNDFDTPVELIVGNYSRRWRVEIGIAEAVKFFHLNALPSPILIKIHFDVTMTMIADTLYSMLASKLRGFENCEAPQIYRHFVRGKGSLSIHNGTISVAYPGHSHNPILRAVPWNRLPNTISWLGDARLNFTFK